MSAAAGRTSTPGRRWLFGPASDLLFGCGLLYIVFFAGQVFAGSEMQAWLPLTLLPFMTLVLGTPHYGATLLRVYADPHDRKRYAFVGIWMSLLLAGSFVTGLHVPIVGSFLVSLYLTWSPWHYAAQNYGVAVLFLRRRGATVTATTGRLIRGTFILSYVLVFLSLHGSDLPTQQALGNFEGSIYWFVSLGIPASLRDPLMALALIAYGVCLGAGGWQLWRAGSLRAAAPTLLLIVIQALWFLLPAIVVIWSGLGRVEPFAPQHRAYAFMWVAAGHFAQYLWITTYFAASSKDRRGRLAYLGRALLVGVSLWTLPVVLFAPDLLGRLPYDLGLGLLAASVVNLHHFVLDGAIWRFRDDRVASTLLRSGDAPAGEAPERPAPLGVRRWAPALGWGLAVLLLLVSGLATWETFAGNRAAGREDVERFELAAERRSLLGRDSPQLRQLFATLALQSDDLARARRELDRGLELHPTAELWTLLGELEEREGDSGAAVAAYGEALALAPDLVVALYRRGILLAERGLLEEALADLTQALKLAPASPEIRDAFVDVRRRLRARAG